MRLIFTKGSGKFDRMEVIRPGRPVESVDCPKQGIIPHDMVHYAVEHVLSVRGFLNRVKQGETASFQMQAEDLSDAVERLVEVFQGDAWSGSTASASELIDMYRVTCQARGCSMLPIDDAAIAAVKARLKDLSAAWNAVAIGQSLALEL